MREIPFGNGTMRYTDDGRSYFLHHSPSSQIKVGEKIRTTQVGRQVTAADAIAGHSYAWDARTGLGDAVANQVSGRGNFANALESTGNPREFSVYLTAADSANVYPDINVPGSAARAIKGEQEVLDMVKIPANMTDEEAGSLIRQMTRKHGVFEVEDRSAKKIVNESILATRGDEALGNFLEGHGEGVIRGHIQNVKKQLMSGGRKGIYTEASALPHLGQLGKMVEDVGDEAAYAFAKKQFTASALKLNTAGLSAEVSSRAIGTTQAMIDKAAAAQQLIASARSSSTLLDVASNASAAVASGTKNSRTLRALGAAKAVFKTRF